MMLHNNDQSQNDNRIQAKRRPFRLMRTLVLPNQHLASFVDLRQWMSPIDEQGHMQTCAAVAFAGVCDYLFKRFMNNPVKVSRLFIYYNAQMIEQKSREVDDNGVLPMNTALGLRKYGVCEESYWPYQNHLLNQMPSDSAYKRASRYTVVPVHTTIDINAIEVCLHNQLPVLVGIRLADESIREVERNGGYLRVPDLNGSTISSVHLHGIVIVGYDRSAQYFICRNSWGRRWGYRGYFYMPYEYLTRPSLVDDVGGIWSILKILPRTNTLPTVRRLLLS
ncbi:unnamed protein product [Adineta ricciae]|uniref:Peptidase C1A papain C-terminal domain-containing protein n=1 Tax=Adineta ricciae TaxID=249248 RepID=A0A815PQA7_ADIRI|nr:unnamed protein product [Adineta ricciae]CAF1451891.1 unnamed protein product [Adineta ricciae]